jgi:serine/threonine protein kinase/tetratricopeptide (TPR) repeat protein
MPEARNALHDGLADRYRIERELGEGGMAVVYLAHDVRHGRKVAIKVIRPEIAATLGTDRFLSEITVTARLHHPHILGLIDSGAVMSAESGDQLYYVMPYVDGETVRARLARDGPPPIAEAVTILVEVADALACAHGQGIIHRDIKPENILLGQGHAMVADFGIAKALDRPLDGRSITRTGAAVGTPVYMAPEQLVGDPGIDHRADLYSLGVVAYELVTGRRPFAGTDVAGILAAALTQSAPLVSVAAPAAPPRLVTLVAALLERDPAKRPQTAASVRDALRSILAELSASALVAPRPRQIRRVVIGGAAVVGLVLSAVLATSRDWRAAVPRSDAAVPEGTAPRSIAVLPFENINRDSASDYFGDGMAEELISALGRLPGLRVASRTSSFAFKGQNADLKEVRKQLGVGAVLESSLRRDGTIIRITTRLVDVERGTVLWDGRYDSQIRNVLFVQDSIAREIARALGETLVGEPAAVLVRPRIRDPDAHEYYLQGRHYLRQRSPGSMTAAIQAFKEAIKRDSSYAPAWAGLADAYTLAAPFESRPPREVFPEARAAAQIALEIDSTLPEAYISLGMVEMLHDWNWPKAGEHLRKGLRLNQSLAEGRLFYAWYHTFRGQFDSAEVQMAKASELDPLSPLIATRLGNIFSKRRRDALAIPHYRRALELDSMFFFARAALAVSFIRVNLPDSARRVVPHNVVRPGTAETAYPAWVFVQLGDTVAARKELEALEAARGRGYIGADGLAGIYAALGDTARALDLLDQAHRERAFTLPFVRVMAPFESIQHTRRFKRLMDLMGVLPPSPP